MAIVFTDQSVYFHISKSEEIKNQWSLPTNKDQFQCKFTGKSWPPSVASNYLYLFVWATLCIQYILIFKSPIWNRAETELKCNTGLRETV